VSHPQTAHLTFKMPECADAFYYAVNGEKYSQALDELDEWLRKKFKYEDLTEVTIDEVRAKIAELKQELELR